MDLTFERVDERIRRKRLAKLIFSVIKEKQELMIKSASRVAPTVSKRHLSSNDGREVPELQRAIHSRTQLIPNFKASHERNCTMLIGKRSICKTSISIEKYSKQSVTSLFSFDTIAERMRLLIGIWGTRIQLYR